MADGEPATPTTGTVDSHEKLPSRPSRNLAVRIGKGVISFGLVIAIFAFLATRLSGTVDLGSVRALITAGSVVVVTALGLFNLATNWPPMATALPGLRVPQAGVANLSSSAVSNTLPEGGAVGTGMTFAILHSWGFRVQAITLSLLTTGIWTNLVRYSLLAAGLVGMATTDGDGGGELGLALVVAGGVATALVLFALVLRSESFATRFGALLSRAASPFARLFRRRPPDLTTRTVGLRSELVTLVSGRWERLTTTMLVSQLSMIAVLLSAIRMMGIGPDEVSIWLVVVAFGGVSLATTVAPTPGGLGVAEAALFAILGPAVPSDQQSALVAAIALYRYATWLLPIPLGAAAYLYWRFSARWKATAAGSPAVASGLPG